MSDEIMKFYTGNTTEVMRIERDRIWVNPEISVDEAAQAVISALEAHIKNLTTAAFNAGLEAAARVAYGTGDEQMEAQIRALEMK